MEELESALALNFSVSNEQNNPSAVHPRCNMYKYKNKLADHQDARRAKAVEMSKSHRYELLNHIRNLTGDLDGDGSESKSDNHLMEMECGEANTKQYRNAKSTKKKSNNNNHLMLSEWLMEVPENFEQNYSVVLCPAGKRCLVVASKGKTRCYDKKGSLMRHFCSALNGGNFRLSSSPQESTVLDCIYCFESGTFYVLDMLSCNGLHMHDNETEFRWYWLKTKLSEEMEGVNRKSDLNPYPFVIAPRYNCARETLEAVFSKVPDFKLDGLLFYHKNYPYVSGFSPVTTWLKPYMLSEFIGLQIHECFMEGIPSWYTGFSDHCEFTKNKAKQWKSKKQCRDKNTAEEEANEELKVIDGNACV